MEDQHGGRLNRFKIPLAPFSKGEKEGLTPLQFCIGWERHPAATIAAGSLSHKSSRRERRRMPLPDSEENVPIFAEPVPLP
jgi:hypothetical protein